jgi:uncharacterized membrane protein
MFNRLNAKLRLLFSVLVFGVAYLLLPDWMRLATRIIAAWDISAVFFLTMAWITMNAATPLKMRHNAQRQDNSRLIIASLVIASACASLLAIGFMLKGSKSVSEWVLTLHIVLAIVTITISWLLTHTMFALHYAHRYYRDDEASRSTQAEGLQFPGEDQPDYWDFLYFSFVIGMTCQVSDVQTESSPMRRLALVHGILSFIFNTVILAISINIVAGLIAA